MAAPDVVPGVQLPVDGVGKIMGDVAVEVPTPSGPVIVHVPASIIVDGSGREIGSKLARTFDTPADQEFAAALREENGELFV